MLWRVVLAVVGVVLAAAVAVPPALADPLPIPYPTSPDGDPPGANDWDCRPSAQRPTPVVLVHGTFGDRKHLLEGLSRGVKAAGYCVFSLDYGNRGTRDIRESAEELKVYVRRVLRATGAERVSMVGHSQGGMMPRYYIKFLGGARYVDDLVGMAPSNHGTTLIPAQSPFGAVLPGLFCESCNQQAAGSRFLRRLNRGDETPGRVSYTQITSRYDEIVVPHTSGYLDPGRRTTNVTVQDKCPRVLSEHGFVASDPVAVQIVLNALGRRGPARKDFRPTC